MKSPCAAIGEITTASVSGHTTGPPAEKEYAVDPVGVARIIPSAPYVETSWPSTTNTRCTGCAGSVCFTTASLSAQSVMRFSPGSLMEISKVERFSSWYSPSARRCIRVGIDSGEASARKPMWPALIPSRGILKRRADSAAARMVPSPPIARTRSGP